MKLLMRLFILSFFYSTFIVYAKADDKRVAEQPYMGYLFAYFEGTGDRALHEHIRFAVSEDAVNWKALNHNYPIILSDSVSRYGN